MSNDKQSVDTVKLNKDRPTEVPFSELTSWVLWQFPKVIDNGMCGAVRPPIAGHSWFPAIIRKEDQLVWVHGHLDQQFPTPEAAAESLCPGRS